MNTWIKILISLIVGWVLAYFLVGLTNYLSDSYWTSILMWHWAPIYNLAGNGPLLGYDASGNPRYEGTPVHIVFGIAGYLAGFVIYPILILLIWKIISKIRYKTSE